MRQDPLTFGHNRRPSSMRMDEWLQDVLERRDLSISFELIATTLWCIRKKRNDSVFRGSRPNATNLIHDAELILKSYTRWNKKDLNIAEGRSSFRPKWIPPTTSALKLNIDASIGNDTTNGAIAGVLRDSKGTLLDGFVEIIPPFSPIVAEAQALVHGLNFLKSRREKKMQILVESDCYTLVSAVNAVGELSWEDESRIGEAQHLLAKMNNVSVAHCDRRANEVADWLAKTHRSNNVPLSWLSRPPQSLWNLLCFDAPSLGFSCNDS
ncbi:uncharacterized protein LOC125316155 [Rhodamnia argentea]|uniref:Uncharacterized protein LOC125316155 n=1 Tax=Rhodamnia argentea TaxID=178133 RepID=A0ABM3HSJ7_9MYRT|nr:uncharacterized protein LOC125316155 [Rhodamnia argentea]